MWSRFRITRDTVIVLVALAWGTYEILQEGREAVLIFIAAVLASPLVMRADEAKRIGGGQRDQAKADE